MSKNTSLVIHTGSVDSKIYLIRGKRVMFDQVF